MPHLTAMRLLHGRETKLPRLWLGNGGSMTPEVFRKLLVAGTAVAALQRSAVSTERGDREGHGTERPVIAGEGSRDAPFLLQESGMRPTPMTDTQQKAEAMEHGELIARLEAASEGSRELDRELMLLVGDAREVDHCTFYGPDERVWYFGEYERETDLPPLPYLTSSLDAIVALIERSNWKLYSVDASVDGRPSCFIKGPDRLWPADDESDEHFGPGWKHGRAKSLPLALCIALLRALRTQDQGDQTNGS